MFADYAILIPLFPALGWLLITLFSKSMPGRSAAWFATGMIALSAVVAIGIFAEAFKAAPEWNPNQMGAIYRLEKAEREKEKLEKAAKAAEAKPAGMAEGEKSGEHSGAMAKEGEHSNEAVSSPKHHSEELHAAIENAIIKPASSGFPFVQEWSWLAIKGEAGIPYGHYIDQVAAITLLMVTIVCTLIHLFAVGYMWGEERYPTFFAYINLFAAAMLAMVMAKNFFHLLLYWEIMGLMSYLLIGFFYKKKSAQQAQKKAFLTVRVGDLAFMGGLFWLYQCTGTLDIPTIIAQGANGELSTALGGAATGIGLLLFLAAVGKSAQFPLHVWLPDAMEGPTPVSAMIHAATMVAAGVYLVARAFPIMDIGNVLPIIAWIGGITALFAATMAPAQADAKKIMAFSTLSQLGYMFMSLGVFGYTAAIFHLLTHAFFKALLFLGSGSMIHGSGTQDIFEMDHLAKYQKWTLGTVWVGALSLMGVPLTAGFWSKDEILHAVQSGNGALYIMGAITAVLTAFYTTRMMIIAFHKPKTVSPWYAAEWNQEGEPTLNMSRADADEQAKHDHGHHASDHPHESGPEMIVPLVVLATLAFVMGFVGSPIANGWFQRFVYYGTPEVVPIADATLGYILSLVFVLAGAGFAFQLYYRRDHTVQIAPNWLTMLLQRRYFVDDFYYEVVTKLAQAPAAIAGIFDRLIVDKVVDAVGAITAATGDVSRRIQTGAVGWYAGLIIVGAAVLALAFAYAGGGR
jgi:NADH-quinone oxidoreductase subunit L